MCRRGRRACDWRARGERAGCRVSNANGGGGSERVRVVVMCVMWIGTMCVCVWQRSKSASLSCSLLSPLPPSSHPSLPLSAKQTQTQTTPRLDPYGRTHTQATHEQQNKQSAPSLPPARAANTHQLNRPFATRNPPSAPLNPRARPHPTITRRGARGSAALASSSASSAEPDRLGSGG